MVHCSGGAQTKILHFIEGLHVVKDKLFPVPTLFKIIQEESGTPWREMYQVFNMGHRMELYVPEFIAEDLISISESFNVDARVIGYVEAFEGKKLTIKAAFGDLEY
jgi:phosphoribosylformylglycinamidine cyclo-ligase